MHAELRAQGFELGRNRVARIMREEGIPGRRKPRFRRTTDSEHTLPVAANLLDRQFAADAPDAPDAAWVADISTLETELVHNVIFMTRVSARYAIAEWIEIFYNGKRRHSSLGHATPLEAERSYYEQQQRTLRDAA